MKWAGLGLSIAEGRRMGPWANERPERTNKLERNDGQEFSVAFPLPEVIPNWIEEEGAKASSHHLAASTGPTGCTIWF